jgi:DNA-binding NtrC family response regulator
LIDRYSKRAGKKFSDITKKTLELFQAYDWPGNIRELQNVIERAVVLCDGDTFWVDETWLKRRSAPMLMAAMYALSGKSGLLQGYAAALMARRHFSLMVCITTALTITTPYGPLFRTRCG